MSKLKSVSVIGRGDFGKLICSFVPKDIACQMYGRSDTAEQIKTIAQSDIIVLSIPLDAYPSVLKLLQPVLRPETLIVDVCSVKVKPAELIHRAFPEHENILLTHPLFGPQSIDNGEKHTLVVTGSHGELAQEVETYCQEELDLEVLHLSNEAHDERMAEVHALTFFIARGLRQLHLHSKPFMTPSFKSLLKLSELDVSQSEALFETIENGNPYGQTVRKEFIDRLREIDQKLKEVN